MCLYVSGCVCVCNSVKCQWAIVEQRWKLSHPSIDFNFICPLSLRWQLLSPSFSPSSPSPAPLSPSALESTLILLVFIYLFTSCCILIKNFIVFCPTTTTTITAINTLGQATTSCDTIAHVATGLSNPKRR